jgi:Lrp/AsnC family transcriptional regulator for asnA, asnC and gidA
MQKMDELDWKIIQFLIKDGRMSSADIARELGSISARTVTNRIDSLLEQGIMDIRPIVNPENLGYCVLADVFIEVEPGKIQEVTEELEKLPQISYLALAVGETDIIISVRAREINELYDFVTETIGKISGVRHTNTFPLPVQIKDYYSWLPPDIDTSTGNSSD